MHPVGVEVFRADQQTDMTKLTVAFRNFAKALKIFCGKNSCSSASAEADGIYVCVCVC